MQWCLLDLILHHVLRLRGLGKSLTWQRGSLWSYQRGTRGIDGGVDNPLDDFLEFAAQLDVVVGWTDPAQEGDEHC